VYLAQDFFFTGDFSVSKCNNKMSMHNFRRRVHGQDAQSPHHANASPHGGKAYLELPRLIMKKERNVRSKRWSLVLSQPRRLALITACLVGWWLMAGAGLF
jgi:hypothetical protein